MRLAGRGFSFARSFGGLAVRLEDLWGEVATAASDMASRARAGLRNLGDSVDTVARRVGDGQIAAQRQNAQLVQALAANAQRLPSSAVPRTANRRSTPKAPELPAQLRAAAAPARSANNIGQPIVAGLKGLQGALYGGADDYLIAGMQTLLGEGGDRPALERLFSNVAQQQSYSAGLRDQNPLSSSLGSSTGLVASLATGAPAAAARVIAPKALGALKNGRELGDIPRLVATPLQHSMAATAGGALNAGIYGLFDAASGDASSRGDLLGAFVGGVLGTPATTFGGPTFGAAVEGVATSLTQDMLNGREISLYDAVKKASLGASLSSLGDKLGTRWMTNLPTTKKGKVGDQLSIVKRLADLDVPNFKEVPVRLPSGRITRLDPASSRRKKIEAKAGKQPTARPNQLEMWALDPEGYQFDWWHDADVGRIAGYLGGTAASNAAGSIGGSPSANETNSSR